MGIKIKAMKEICTNTKVRVMNHGIEMPAKQEDQSIALEEPSSKITATISKKSLSTVVKNENVENYKARMEEVFPDCICSVIRIREKGGICVI